MTLYFFSMDTGPDNSCDSKIFQVDTPSAEVELDLGLCITTMEL